MCWSNKVLTLLIGSALVSTDSGSIYAVSLNWPLSNHSTFDQDPLHPDLFHDELWSMVPLTLFGSFARKTSSPPGSILTMEMGEIRC